MAGKNFITDPLLPPGGLPGKFTGEETRVQCYLDSRYVGLEVEAGSEIQGFLIRGKFKASLKYIRPHLKNNVFIPYNKL